MRKLFIFLMVEWIVILAHAQFVTVASASDISEVEYQLTPAALNQKGAVW